MEATASKTPVVVVAGGGLGTSVRVPDGAIVIAADSGYDHAVAAGIAVDLLIGDLDSLSPAGRRHAAEHEVPTLVHPADKDATDLELALDAARSEGATSITVFGGEGGSPGHRLAGTLALTSHELALIDVAWHVAGGTIHVLRPGRDLSISGGAGTPVTIVPVGDVEGATTEGLRWRLADERLPAGSTRGTNNVLEQDHGSIRIGSGVALVVVEGATP